MQLDRSGCRWSAFAPESTRPFFDLRRNGSRPIAWSISRNGSNVTVNARNFTKRGEQQWHKAVKPWPGLPIRTRRHQGIRQIAANWTLSAAGSPSYRGCSRSAGVTHGRGGEAVKMQTDDTRWPASSTRCRSTRGRLTPRRRSWERSSSRRRRSGLVPARLGVARESQRPLRRLEPQRRVRRGSAGHVPPAVLVK